VSENSSEPAVTPVRNRLAQSSATPPLPPFQSIEAKSEHGSSEELSWQSLKSSHRASQPAPPRIPTDNRLRELLDQAFEKAIVEPAERRRLQFSKEVIDNARVQHFVRYYSSIGKTRFQELLARSGKYIPMVAKVLSQEGLPEELGYLPLLVESEFIATNISRAGAVGLWQFVASTARQYDLRIDEWVDERRESGKIHLGGGALS
jgi:soluble lytic murein transglycosylase-like protein